MSRKWIRSFSWVVLASFLLLLLPKSILHDCDHGAPISLKHHHGTKTVITNDVEKCAICDLHIPLLSTPLESQSAQIVTFEGQSVQTNCAQTAFGIAQVLSLRGPPFSMM